MVEREGQLHDEENISASDLSPLRYSLYKEYFWFSNNLLLIISEF